MFKKSLVVALLAIASFATVPADARGGGRGGPPSKVSLEQSGRTSPHDAINNQRAGGNVTGMVTIYYGRPFSKAPNGGEVRKIWGSLVPWDQVWRLGSDEATTMIAQKDVQIGDLAVPAGAYTLCMVPSEKGTSKLIINKQIGQWGIPYTADIQKNELGRVDLKKEPDLDNSVDQLTLSFDSASGGSTLKITWEKSQYSILIKPKS